MSATARQAQDERGQAERLGIKPGQVVQELGYDTDCDEQLRQAITAVEGVELVDEDFEEDVVDVVVMDGFVGNIVLKFTEGLAAGLFQTILAELEEADAGLLEQFKPVMKKIYQKHDWQEYGGAPLLGVGGYCLICHGRSDSRAIMNAIRVGKQLATSGINEIIVKEVAASIPGGE